MEPEPRLIISAPQHWQDVYCTMYLDVMLVFCCETRLALREFPMEMSSLFHLAAEKKFNYKKCMEMSLLFHLAAEQPIK